MISVFTELFSNPGRTSKQCRERWNNYLDPTLVHTAFTEEEDKLILSLHQEYGSKWAMISRQLSGRTENSVKLRFHTLQKKLLSNPIALPIFSTAVDPSDVGSFGQSNQSHPAPPIYPSSLQSLFSSSSSSGTASLADIGLGNQNFAEPSSYLHRLANHINVNTDEEFSNINVHSSIHEYCKLLLFLSFLKTNMLSGFVDSYQMRHHAIQAPDSQELEPPMKRYRSDNSNNNNSASSSSSSLSHYVDRQHNPSHSQSSFFSPHHETSSLSEWINVVDPTLLHQATLQMNEEDRGIFFSDYPDHNQNLYHSYNSNDRQEEPKCFCNKPPVSTSFVENDIIEQDVLEDSDNEKS
jgi:hypothetical protein